VVLAVDFQPLALNAVSMLWVQSGQELWMLSYGEAIQLAYVTSGVLLTCRFVPEIMHRSFKIELSFITL
jgi:hypothetical protein